jgi:restriction system protein
MTVLDAIEHVLRDAGGPLHYREIAIRLIAQGLWQTRSKTPATSVSVYLSNDIRDLGSASRFRRINGGIYGLSDEIRQATVSASTRQFPGPVEDAVSDAEPLAPRESAVLPTGTQLMSFSDAAEQVLEQYGDTQPMHYRDITKRAKQLGLIATHGKTPEATMYTQIYSEIDRQIRRGERPRFVKAGRGLFGLSSWMSTGLAFQIAEHNRKIRDQLVEQVRGMNPYEFEALAGQVLAALGFDTSVTRSSGDGGIDVRGTLIVGDVIRTRMAVQVKRYRQNVQAPIVQQMRGSLGVHEQGLIITTSDFSSGAREEAERPNATPIALMNGEQFVKLMIEHEIGVHRESHYIIEIGEKEVEG